MLNQNPLNLSAEQRQELERYCRERSVSLLVLFGSRATGRATEQSDVDVGILLQQGLIPPEEFLQRNFEISRRFGVSDLHLVDLRRASGLLQHRAAETGMVIFDSEPGEFRRFRVLAAKRCIDEAFDLKPLYEHYLRDSSERWTDGTC